MKVCFYAINGQGLGHLSRCYAVAKKLRCLLEMLGQEADIQFLTTSEADYLVRDFPVFKIPSRAGFQGRRGAASRYAANGKMMVSGMLAHFSPDLLVMDTIAQGSFQEFAFVKDFAKNRVLIDRHKRSEYRGARVHQAHLPLFDKILVPDDEEYRQDYSYGDEVLGRVKFVGKVHNFERSEAWGRERVREYFHVSGGQKLVYLSAGGGGDAEAEEQVGKLLDVLLSFDVKVILGYGALSSCEKVYGKDNVVAVTECGVSRYFNGVDLAVSAAGYNTYEELMAAGVNSLFFVQTKGMDVQERRVEQGAEAGWHGVVDLDCSREVLLEEIRCGLEAGVPGGLMSRDYAVGDSVAAYEMVTTCLRGSAANVELRLEASMALLALESYSLGYWGAESVSECYRLWKVFVVECDGGEGWQERCIAAASEKDVGGEVLKLLGVELLKMAQIQESLTEAGMSWGQQLRAIKDLVKDGVNSLRGDCDNQRAVEKLLTKQNYVD
ncbi:MAG: hypothetical protein ACSHX6_08525 [Akkermansiaceae bacterium]